MWKYRGLKTVVSPWTAVLLALFLLLSSWRGVAAILSAALFHELGHYLVLRRWGVSLDGINISPFGAEMRLQSNCRLSYGQEMLAVAAGPVVNLLLGGALSAAGAYYLAGIHLVLAFFNLLPIRPLDGGQLLWLSVAWAADPFLADRVLRCIGVVLIVLLGGLGGCLWLQQGSPFLLFAAVGLGISLWKEKGLVKEGKSRYYN